MDRCWRARRFIRGTIRQTMRGPIQPLSQIFRVGCVRKEMTSGYGDAIEPEIPVANVGADAVREHAPSPPSFVFREWEENRRVKELNNEQVVRGRVVGPQRQIIEETHLPAPRDCEI